MKSKPSGSNNIAKSGSGNPGTTPFKRGGGNGNNVNNGMGGSGSNSLGFGTPLANAKGDGSSEDGSTPGLYENSGGNGAYSAGGGGAGMGGGGTGNTGFGFATSGYGGAGAGGANANGSLSFGDDSAQGGMDVMGSEDPEDYFARTNLDESLFKIVEKRYRSKSTDWIKDSLRKTP